VPEVKSPSVVFSAPPVGSGRHDQPTMPVSPQTNHHPREEPLVAPSLPAVIVGYVRTILLGRIAPAQAVAVDEDYRFETENWRIVLGQAPGRGAVG
jgi:hypothetical protein